MASIGPDSIVGIPITRIRPIFKMPNITAPNVTRLYNNEYFQEKFKLSEAQAADMITQLQQLGYLSNEPDKDKFYEVTKDGKLFGLEKSNKPISIEKADMLYAEFLEKIKIVNENPDFILKVSGYGLWGDYINGNSSINTIDILLVLAKKDPDSYREKMQERWKTYSGYLNIEDRYAFPMTEIKKFLKARSPYLSIYLPLDQKKSADIVKFFDADGNYIHYTYKEKKESKHQSENKPSKQNNERGLVGRLLLNERKGKASKSQIIRKFTEKEVELPNVHDQVLDGMVKLLRKEYPECIISPECFMVGLAGRIDIVRQTKDGVNILYEIKTYAKAINSIRVALGQLFEYSFYPDRKSSQELYIVSHVPASLADLKYLKHVEEMMGIKLGYLHYNCQTNEIEMK
jgi:hypothetical protein